MVAEFQPETRWTIGPPHPPIAEPRPRERRSPEWHRVSHQTSASPTITQRAIGSRPGSARALTMISGPIPKESPRLTAIVGWIVGVMALPSAANERALSVQPCGVWLSAQSRHIPARLAGNFAGTAG